MRNILFCGAGIVLGFIIGFLAANSMARTLVPPQANTIASAPAAPGSAPPLDPAQGDTLPPNHPSIDGNATGSTPAATSAQAQKSMEDADRNPKDFDRQMAAAVVFYQMESMDKASLYLQRALALKPDDPDALTGMGHTKFDSGDYTGAASFYERVLTQRPNDADVRTDLGNTYFRRTPPDYDRAIAEYRKALQVEPSHELALQRLAAAAIFKRDKATAREQLDKLASVNPDSPALKTLRENLDAMP